MAYAHAYWDWKRDAGSCFSSQLGRCHGACHGKESKDSRDARAREALERLRVQQWPWPGRIAIGEGATDSDAEGALAWHLVDHWCYLGSVKALDATSLATLDERPVSFDIDTYKILRRALDQHTGHDQRPSQGQFKTASLTIHPIDTDGACQDGKG
ncbi:hypothetical protein [Onishia niordana]|uniref:hypothetical protein n=1 Tax=Onishia niordana TaxID=2508711 RepID=UPI00109F479F|nr:hypothetical protein [Halomonas niordiana]